MYLFNRTISTQTRTDDGKLIFVEGLFLDTYHEINLSLTIDRKQRKIIQAEGELRRTPFSDCSAAQAKIKALEGIEFGTQLRKKLQLAVGGEQGCTHILELALECVRAAFQSEYRLMRDELSEEERDRRVLNLLEGSCFHYRRNDAADDGGF